MKIKKLLKHGSWAGAFSLCLCGSSLWAGNIAYIHGDISNTGVTPASAVGRLPYDQMLLTDQGTKGMSMYKEMVEAESHTISQHYDQNTQLNAAFLAQYDFVLFGLHQKVWSAEEKSALDSWIRAGGSIMVYNDSAAGGSYSVVGAQNPVGQTAVNNLITQYGMQVTVDQAKGGYQGYTAGVNSTHPIVGGGLIFEGEGVSPVAVDPSAAVEILIPHTQGSLATGTWRGVTSTQGITIANPQWATLAMASVGNGHVVASFDRQPMWNNGNGSNIQKVDNREILRRLSNFLATRQIPQPTRIQVEDFDEGAQGVAYFDKTSGNKGGAYRSTDVDISAIANTTDEYKVGWIQAGEYLNYTIDVAISGYYDITFRYASSHTSNKTFALNLNDVELTGDVTVNTGGAGWNAWQETTVTAYIPAGNAQKFTLIFKSSSIDFDYIDILASNPGEVGIDIDATTYDGESSPGNDSIIQNMGTKVGNIKVGDGQGSNDSYFYYDDFDFGIGANTITVRASSGAAEGGTLYVRLAAHYESISNTIATIHIPYTGGWDAFQDFTVDLDQVAMDLHVNPQYLDTLYFTVESFDGEPNPIGTNLFDIKSFRFDQ